MKKAFLFLLLAIPGRLWAGSAMTGVVTDQTVTKLNAIAVSTTSIAADTTTLRTDVNAKVVANGGISGATKTKITYDTKGLVTSGANATTDDVGEGLNNKYWTVWRTTSSVDATAPLSNVAGTFAIDKSSVTLLGPKPTTDSIAEGASNLYWTVWRTTANVSATAPISNTAGTFAIDKASATLLGPKPTTASIPASTDKNYVTDAQLTVIGNTSGSNSGDQTIALTGDVTGTGTGSFATTLAAAQPNITSIGKVGASVNFSSNTLMPSTTFYQDGSGHNSGVFTFDNVVAFAASVFGPVPSGSFWKSIANGQLSAYNLLPASVLTQALGASVSTTTLVTTNAISTTTYQVNMVSECTTASGTSTYVVEVSWTDLSGTARTSFTPSLSGAATGVQQSTLAIIPKAGTAIQYSATLRGTASSVQYALAVTLTQLGP